jgi:vancomycin permeability regulator SanA
LGRKLPYLIVGLALGLTTVMICFVVTYRLIDEQSGRDETRSADVVIVLGSAVWPNEQPSPSLRARTEKAVELYRDGCASALILSGGLGRYPPEEAEVMRRLAAEAGIPRDALILDREAHSTWESLLRAGEIMQEREWRSALIVSDPFHMKRSLLMARDIGLVAYGSPALDSPTYTVPARRVYYTSREVLALWWYLVGRVGSRS